MSKSLRTLFVSVENENDINETTLEVSSDNTMEEEVAEVTEAGIEVIEAEDDVEELHEIAEGLESIVASLEAAVEDGGLDPQAAIFMQHAVNGYTRRVGLEAESIVPSLESFGGASGKAAATTISVESVKATILKIWQAIKNAVAKAIEAIKNFFSKIFQGTKKLKERSSALRKSVAKLGGKKPKADVKLKVPGANTLRWGGKVTGPAIFTGMTKLSENLDKKGLTDSAIQYYDHIATVLDKGEELAKDSEEKFITELARGQKPVSSMNSVVTKDLMSGDSTLEVVKSSAEGETDTLSAPRLVKGKGSSLNENLEVDVPSQKELENVLKGIDSIIKSIESKDKVIESINRARDRSIKAGDKLARKSAEGKLDGKIKQAKVQLAMRMAGNDMTRTVKDLAAHGFNVARAGLAYVDRSVALYESEGKKDKDGK